MLTHSQLILQTILTSLLALGIFAATRPGEILYFWNRLWMFALTIKYDDKEEEHYFWVTDHNISDHQELSLLEKILKYIWKPIVGCPVCMVSVYGIPLYLIMFGMWDVSFLSLCIVLLCAAGINKLLINLL